MAVVLRLARHGQKKRPFYRIVAADKAARRDGRFLEIIGTYNPMVEADSENPKQVTLKEDRIKHWIAKGALPSKMVRSICVKSSEELKTDIETRENARLDKKRAKRKARAARQKSAK